MPSTKTEKLARRCRRTEEATDAYASIAGDVLEERFRPFLSEEEASLFPPGTVAKILRTIGVDTVRGAHQAFVEADEASAWTAEEYTRLCRQRDDTAAALYDVVVEFRKRCRVYMDARQEKIELGISGRTPRGPEDLHRWSGGVVGMVKGHEDKLSIDRGQFKTAPYLKKIERLRDDLGRLLDAIELGKVHKSVALHERRQALAECELYQLHGSRLVESALGLAGRPDLAYQIRGVHPPGRPRKAASVRNSGRNVVRRARESFSRLSAAVRRARESFRSRLRSVRKARGSFSSRSALVRNAWESFSPRGGLVQRARESFSRLSATVRRARGNF